MTVGHHFKLSRPLNNTERAMMSQAAGMLPKNPNVHAALAHRVLITAAWAEIGMAGMGLCGGFGLIVFVVRLKRRRRRA